MQTLDLAQLYLRITVGGMLILHNIGKMQSYNEIISEYHTYNGIPGTLFFLLFASVESITALMLIVGWRVRLASSILILGTILSLVIYFPSPSSRDLELQAIYIFIYIYIFIAGGGLYSFDNVYRSRKRASSGVRE